MRSMCTLLHAALCIAVAMSTVQAQEAGPPPIPKPDSSDACDRDAKVVLSTFEQLPADMRKLTKGDIPKLHRDVDAILNRGKTYLSRCAEHGERAKVIYAVAKVMSLNLQRYLLEVDREWKQRNQGAQPPAGYITAKRDEYLFAIYKLVEEGLLLETDRNGRRDLLKVQGYALFVGGRGQEAAVIWRRLLSDFPDDPECDKTYTSLISSLLRAANKASRELEEADYGVVAQECDAFLEKWGTQSPFFPTVINVRGKALKENGDLEASLEHWDKYLPMLREGAHGKLPQGSPEEASARQQLKDDFARVYEPAPFNVGFCHYALGNPERAAEVWKQYVAELEAKRAQAKISQVEQVYLGRTQRLLTTLDQLQDRPAPLIEIAPWCEAQSFEVKPEKGNVIALFFSPYEQRRSEPFARALEAFYQKNWHEGFRAAMICFPKGSREGQIAAVEGWRQSLGLTYPVGMDSSKERDAYKRYNCAVGSGTVVLIDRAGNVVWYKMDPTERDIELANAVFERHLTLK